MFEGTLQKVHSSIMQLCILFFKCYLKKSDLNIHVNLVSIGEKDVLCLKTSRIEGCRIDIGGNFIFLLKTISLFQIYDLSC